MTTLHNARLSAVFGALAITLLSAATSAPASAQSFSEPAAFAAMHPDRDVLNGGLPNGQILTSETRFNAAHAEQQVVIVKRAGHSARKAH